MYAGVVCQFGVEGTGELVMLAGGDDSTVDGGEDVYVVVCIGDIGGSDEGHGDVADTLEVVCGREATKLSAVGVTAGGNIHRCQVWRSAVSKAGG